MIQQRTRFLAIPGKHRELRAQGTEWVKSQQAKGRRMALAQRLFSTEGMALVIVTLAEDLAALDKIRQENVSSGASAAAFAKTAPLLAEPPKTILLEQVIPLPQGAGPGTTIGQIASFYPKVGAGPELRGKLEAFVKDGQGMGAKLSLWSRLYSSEGMSFGILGRYTDLADLDKRRQGARDKIAALGVSIANLIRQPTQVRIFETVVPLPPA